VAALVDNGNAIIRIATLDTLAVIIRDNGVAVIDQCGHVQSLVTRLLLQQNPRSGDQGIAGGEGAGWEVLA
jgi:hypothetical protein